MKQSIVKIPQVTTESRIGSVFNHIFTVMFQTDQIDNSEGQEVVWDFSSCSFLHPFFIGAISLLKRQYRRPIIIEGVSPAIERYLNLISFHSPVRIPAEGAADLLSTYCDESYLPICLFDPQDKSSDRTQELVQSVLKHQLGYGGTIINILSYLFAELIDNITEHSKSKEGFLFCQYVNTEKMLYVMICDTGRSVYSSYAADKRYCSLLTNLESSGLLLALEGKSTKDRPETENRGYGISKSRSLIIDGLGGEFFIISGSAFGRHDGQGQNVADLPGDLRWNGTAILMKIPAAVPEKFNVYKYIS